MSAHSMSQSFSPFRRLRNRLDAIFLFTVVLPTSFATLYFGFVAADLYVSESHFIVRSEQHQTPSALGALLQGTGFARSQDDTYSVVDFIDSRDALRELDSRLNLRAALSDHGVDVFNRFPGLDRDSSIEALYKLYEKRVEITYDSTSAISVLRVQAFKAEDAAKINETLLEMSERLVNQLNARSRKDVIDTVQSEMNAAEERSKSAALALSAFRVGKGIFDPERQGGMAIESSGKLREELLASEMQLAQVMQVSPNNPQVTSLRRQVEMMRQAIKDDADRLLGRTGSLAAHSPQYQRLLLDSAYADRALAGSLAALDDARNDALRKQLYVERLVQPSVPDKAMEPRRIRSILTVFVLGLVFWGIVSLVVASIREHAD